MKITDERLEQVERYFDRHGGKTILIGRFIGLVRAIAPFIAGSSGPRLPPLHPVQHRRHRSLGDRSSASSATSSGARSTRSPRIAGKARLRRSGSRSPRSSRVVVVVPPSPRDRGLAAAPIATSRPYVRPLFARRRAGLPPRRPAARAPDRLRACASSGDRLTPGELGLELTTALAVGGVGLYVFALYAVDPASDSSAHPVRPRLARPRRPPAHRTAAIDVAKVISRARRLPAIVAAVAARRPRSLLADRRQFGASWSTIVLGFVLVVRRGAAGQGRHRPAAARQPARLDLQRRRIRAATPPTRRPGSACRGRALAAVPASRARRRSSRARSCSPPPSAFRASTCGRTTGPTSPAAGGWASACSACWPLSCSSSSTFATMERERSVRVRRVARPMKRPLDHPDRDRPGRPRGRGCAT